MKKLLLFLFIFTFLFGTVADHALAKGSSGGRSSSSRSFSSRSSSSKTSTSKPKTAAQIKADKVAAQKQAAATAKQKATEQKYQAAASKQPATKTVNGKTYKKGNTVGVGGYQPRFSNGYSAPAGSVVYYNNGFSAWDWIPLYYIMSHNGNQNAVVQQPNGQQVQVQEEGTDGMYVFNWILTILIVIGLIILIVYLVNKYTKKKGVKKDYAY